MYPYINMRLTGMKLKRMVARAGYDVKAIQEYLHLSCPQPIYRWFQGKALPSVDHLYALSVLLSVHMEELLVSDRNAVCCGKAERFSPGWGMVGCNEAERFPPGRNRGHDGEWLCEDPKFRRLYGYYERVSKCA